MRGFRPERLLPLACIGGAVLLTASQFMNVFALNEAGPSPLLQLIDSADQHWYAMAVLGIFAALATVGAVWSGSKPLAIAVVAAGAAALLLFLLIDLPDAGKAGTIDDPTRSFVTAETDPQSGFWIELIGALILTVCGGALATLTSAQLQDLRPRFGGWRDRGGRRARRERPAPPWEGREAEPRPANPNPEGTPPEETGSKGGSDESGREKRADRGKQAERRSELA